jgi:cytochrome c-type biogenesis protein CcmF
VETENIKYIGEHLWAGQLGNIFVILSFSAALLCSLSFLSSANSSPDSANEISWRKIARWSFLVHVISVFGMVGMLFIMFIGHYFEYEYIWHHSSRAMPLQYIASCFWEGQEGSFLLWTFWNAVIGIVLLKKLGSSVEGSAGVKWEAPVMSIVSLVQVFLCSMVLGVYVLDYKLGSNPFTLLLREHPDFKNMPFVQMPDYLAKLDGRGLNPLLQNYWMVIHPPTLFLGFALTVVPFAFAISGLWKKDYNSWQKPALTWTFFGVMVLGTGILMGGAWAYEALSFGGFWAWDPVENASLVPWLTLVGAGHVMMIYKNKGQSLFWCFFLSLIAFILVLYSTFLTRSGILGDTSVHAFTDLGMSGQLLLYLGFFTLLAIVLLAMNFKKFPRTPEEDSIWSREFWMMIGALILLVSAFQISITTSIPVINKVFGTHLAPPAEGRVIQHYHQWQIPFAILILILIASVQFFKYKKTDPKEIRKNILIPFSLSIISSAVIAISFHWFSEGVTSIYSVLLFACLYAVFANITYFIKIIKGRFDHAGASIAHIGFGLILLGAMLSTSRSEKISINHKGDVGIFGKDFSNKENILLQRNDTVKMGDYYVTYKDNRKEGVNVFYDVEYLKKDESGKYTSSFILKPRIQLNPRMGNVAEPDTRHFLTKDIYTHVTYADLENANKNASAEEYKEPQNNTIAKGDTFFTANSIVVLESLTTDINKDSLGIPKADVAVGAKLKVYDVFGKTWEPVPVYYIADSTQNSIEATVEELGLKFKFWHVNPETGKVDISVAEKLADKKDFIVMKAIVFPYINILWTGCIIMIIGTLLAIRNRVKKSTE